VTVLLIVKQDFNLIKMNTVQSGGQGVSTAKKDPGLEVRKITFIRIVEHCPSTLSHQIPNLYHIYGMRYRKYSMPCMYTRRGFYVLQNHIFAASRTVVRN
jgi:hypothetical protein